MGSAEMIVLDTHALVWWIGSPEKLSDKARRVIERTIKTKEVFVSSISIWEIALLSTKGRLTLTMDVERWIELIEQIPGLQFVPVDNRIALSSVTLPGRLHPDPADRMIISTARFLGARVITSDTKIRQYRHVRSTW